VVTWICAEMINQQHRLIRKFDKNRTLLELKSKD